MQASVSNRSKLPRVEVAAVMAMATAKRAADVDVVSVYPHAHYLAREMKGVATLPDGTTVQAKTEATYRLLLRGATVSILYDPKNPRRSAIYPLKLVRIRKQA